MKEYNKSLNRMGGIDLFRIVSTIVVWMFHSIINNGCSYGIMNPFLSVGAVFMTAFFLISGYSLYYIYSKSNLQNIQGLKKFYIKRLISIMPAYYITSFLYLIFRNTETLKQTVALAPIEILGLQSVFTSLFSISHNSGTWFISCLLICYMLFPFMCSLGRQMKFKYKSILMFVMVGVILYSQLIVQMFSLARIYTNPFFRGCEFFIGVLLCASQNEIDSYRLFKKIFYKEYMIIVEGAALVVGISIIVKLEIASDYMFYSGVALPLFMLQLIALAKMPLHKFGGSKFIPYISSLCYGFYLSQFFSTPIVNKLIDRGFLANNLMRIIAFFALTSFFAVGIHELIEKPCKNFLGKRLF